MKLYLTNRCSSSRGDKHSDLKFHSCAKESAGSVHGAEEGSRLLYMCSQELPEITCSGVFNSKQQPTGPSLKAPGHEKASATTQDSEKRGSPAKLCTWPPLSPPTLFPLPVSCYDFFFLWLYFRAGKRGIQAPKPPGTAGLAKHRGILERLCRLITLPWLISAASLSPCKPNVIMWQWNAGNTVIKMCETGLCCFVTFMLHYLCKRQQESPTDHSWFLFFHQTFNTFHHHSLDVYTT